MVVVDEPTTKLAALTSGELDFAGIQPAHAAFVRRDPALAVLDLSAASDLRHRVQHPAAAVRRPRDPPCGERRDRPAGDRRRLPVRVRHAGARTGAAGSARISSGGRAAGESAVARRCRAGASRFELLTVGSGEAALEQMVQARLAAPGST